MVTNRIIFYASRIQPNPEEIDYWVDLTEDPYGGAIKYYNGTSWLPLNTSGGGMNPSQYYTKTLINELLNKKADTTSVDSKVDDEEVKDVIKGISFNTSDPNNVTLVLLKYDDTTGTKTMPVASATSAGIVTSKDFIDFVKLNQLQELHTEMIDLLADIRAKFLKKLVPGLNITIDPETNVISATGNLAVQWNNILGKPDFKKVATSGDYNDLINKLTAGKGISIDNNNVVSTTIDPDALIAGINTLYDEVVANTNAIEGDILAVVDSLNQEILDRTQADTTINENVAGINTRVTTAEGKLNTIQGTGTGSIAKALSDAKSYTDTQVSAELTRAEGVELTIAGDLAAEVTRAKGAESANATAIQNEVARATGIEGALRTDVDNISGQVSNLSSTKVDKVSGKGLSTEDYTTAEKTKLSGIETGANKYVLPKATTTALGGIIVGTNLSIDSTGKLNSTYVYTLPTASSTVLGGVKIGSNITNTSGTISLTKANVVAALGVDPTTKYVTLDTELVITGLKSWNNAAMRLPGHYYHNGYSSTGTRYVHYYSNDPAYDEVNSNSTEVEFRVSNGDGSYSAILFSPTQFSNRKTLSLGTNTYRWNGLYTYGVISSSMATGTQPIQVTSTTTCTNLNADMIDGYHADQLNKVLLTYLNTSVGDGNNILKLCSLYNKNTYSGSSYLFKIASRYSNVSYLHVLLNTDTPITNIANVTAYFVGYNSLSRDTFYYTKVFDTDLNATRVDIYAAIGDYNNFSFSLDATGTNGSRDYKIINTLLSTIPSGAVQIENLVNNSDADWYGVSWSETSSNPVCTRIGNLDMHRLLPILNGMKGYAIGNSNNPAILELIVPLPDDWEGTTYGHTAESATAVINSSYVNTMVKIPEFWWTDDYEHSTKTHNLKIALHAKPGWNHHKESYVGAYEGYQNTGVDNVVRYQSISGKIPTVNITRTTIRETARKNGSVASGADAEYKWNIYTYNEHRAICHLFLVEYATRNSQQAVNNLLSILGFKQGGLGTGCTTGTVGGAYSFIPTGTSNALGNGSGEVTWTDGTNTRKCNRYRGIENPFGHIWKHTDDVISKYASNIRSWYKCEKPSKFDTYMNSNYKPLCGFTVPANGYKKTIHPTPTCDFFAEATGGSETTYWCDYNYDNTDASEHCLLIGGHSGNGGWAGLFTLASNVVVGASVAYVGSRLVYLPWAE